MTNKGGHYEQAFQAYLDRRQFPYVTISQARKAVLHGTAQKSFDFIVHKSKGSAMLIDIKGRKLKSAAFTKSNPGQNWVTIDDVESMLKWQAHFGSDHIPLFVFAYWIFDLNPQPATPTPFASIAARERSRSLRLPPQSSVFTRKLHIIHHPGHTKDCFLHNSRYYWFVAIDVADYQALMKTRSPKWNTVNLPAQKFRHLSKPFSHFLS